MGSNSGSCGCWDFPSLRPRKLFDDFCTGIVRGMSVTKLWDAVAEEGVIELDSEEEGECDFFRGMTPAVLIW